MVYVYVVLSLAFLISVAVANDSEGGLARRCRLTLEGQSFDLCPIFDARGEEDVWTIEDVRQTPPTITTVQYKFALDKPLKKDGTLPAHEQCPDGTWICMTMTNTRPHHESEPPRTLQLIPVAGRLSLSDKTVGYTPGLNVTASLEDSREKSHHKILRVRLHGGYYVDKAQKADFYFFCDHKATEPTKPSLYFNWQGSHAFRWNTKHACPLRSEPPPSDSPSDTPDEEQPPPASDDETELINVPDRSDRRSKSSWALLLSSTSLVLVMVYLIYYPPRRLRRLISSLLKQRPSLLRFRVGENVLLRWAQEDMELNDGEEDFMVNGAARDGESIFAADEDDESIPLTPSPRKLHGDWNYGSM